MAKNDKNDKTQTGNNLFAKRLKEAKERWNDAKEESKKPGGGVDLEAGRYICKLTDATLRDGKNDTIGVVFSFEVQEGDSAGKTVNRWAGFDTDDRMIYLQRDLRRLGADVDDLDIEQIPDLLAELKAAAPTVRITVKINGEYTNVYIDKLIDTEEGGTEAGGGEGGGEDGGEEEEELEVGTKVAYKLKGKKQTGVVKKVNEDTVDIKNDATKKVDVDIDKDSVQALAEVE